jgi:DNA-binding NarL/FixJ family response regulator
MSDFSDRIIELLRASPDGLTSNDIAERLGTAI